MLVPWAMGFSQEFSALCVLCISFPLVIRVKSKLHMAFKVLQLAELVALTRALELSKGEQAIIYKDSKYAYLTLHAHAAIWKERQLNNNRRTY